MVSHFIFRVGCEWQFLAAIKIKKNRQKTECQFFSIRLERKQLQIEGSLREPDERDRNHRQ